MPEADDGVLWGFQLWVNLPAGEKMGDPRYQDIAAERIPPIQVAQGVEVRVIAGAFGNLVGPIRGVATAPVYLDLALDAGARVDVPLPHTHSAFVYVYEGGAAVGLGADTQVLLHGELGVLVEGERVHVACGDIAARMLIIAGRPLREPVSKYGPIVMNTPEQVVEAIRDLQSGSFSRR
jgi:redox-sensitive bicupin YhaK (pirin superfamily)